MKHFILLLTTVSILSGCSRDDKEAEYPASRYSVTMITSTGGNGDNGYNDLVLAGVMRFYNEHEDDLRFSLQKPYDNAEARDMLDRWIQTTAGRPGEYVAILASDTYRNLLTGRDISLASNQHIVLFECEDGNLPENVSTFRICRYGASYLCGASASESPEAHIVAAMNGDGLLHDAITGFSDGYRDESGRDASVHFLADDEAGYGMPNEAYRMASGFDESFVFPVAGGSNSGLFKYTREDEFTLLLVAGMDVDCSEYSTRVPFSMLVHIDRVIYRILDIWISGGELPVHTDYSLTDRDAIEVTANPFFMERVNIFLDYYSDDAYWYNQIEKHYESACRKEKLYYE